MNRPKAILLFFFIIGSCHQISAQARYQSLMWEITGNGLTKPSYLYGTMHISGKMAFHLGDPFYEALESADVVALELEPEAWLKAIFDDRSSNWYSRPDNDWTTEYGFGYEYEAALPQLRNKFAIDTEFQQKVKQALMYDPALLNYLLFRYGAYGYEADFEEDTWLDMYIYQTGKKLGKRTLGLETYAQSDYFIRQSRKEERNSKEYREYDEGDIKELQELQLQFEPAYRRQDLDLIDSLNKRTTSPAFDKYILIERNKVFIENIDSVLHTGQSIFACMGCAHLPGKSGIIELLRQRGYQVNAFNKGERDTKRRAKLDKVIYKRAFKSFETNDHVVKFETPSPVFYLGADKNFASWISLDIANGASFLVQRMKTYSGLTHRDPEDIIASIDSVLYETIAGDIISQKKINVGGFPAIEVLNRSRRGDYQKRLIVALPEELVILKLTATGDKVKTGYGNEFFSLLKLEAQDLNQINQWTSDDASVSFSIPGSIVYYGNPESEAISPDFEVSSGNFNNHECFLAQRHTVNDPEFLDEDGYELNRLADAFMEDNGLSEISRNATQQSLLPALRVNFKNKLGEKIYALFVIQNLNYCAFSAYTNDSLKAAAYFDSIKFSKKQHNHFQLFSDTTMFFEAMLPYVPTADKSDDVDGDWYFESDEEENNSFIGAAGSRNYAVPGETDLINVEYQRYHKFSDGEDSLKFYLDKENMLKRNDMFILSKNVQWNDKGCMMNFILADTNSSRRYQTKIIQYNKTVYTIQSSYDTVLGAGDFITKFFESFHPTDTVFPYYHYRNRDNEFLDQLMSSDSTAQQNAIGIITEMDFSAQNISRIRNILKEMPQIDDVKKREMVKEKLTSVLAADTSKANVHYIVDSFYQNMDSTAYQVELLSALTKIKTATAFESYRKLLMDEPPVLNGRNSTDGFDALFDTLELVAPFMSDYMKLLALNEYEKSVFELMAASLDSNLIKPAVYKNMVGQLVMEAKNELKRLNSTGESSFQFDTDAFLNFCTLLQPYRNQPDVNQFFDKAYKSKRIPLLLDLLAFDLRHDVAPRDSVISRICSYDDQMIPLYQVLHEHQMENHLPNKFLNQEVLLTFYLKEKFKGKYKNDGAVDSVTVIEKKTINIRGHELEAFYCKFKKAKTKQWLGTILAFDATDKGNLWPVFIESEKTIVLDKDEDEHKELDRELKLLEESNRRKINFSRGMSYRATDWD